jgi:hypothetical protein
MVGCVGGDERSALRRERSTGGEGRGYAKFNIGGEVF